MSSTPLADAPRVAGPRDAVERVWLALPLRHPRAALLAAARDAVAGLAETLAAVVPVAVLVDPDDDVRAARMLPRAVQRVGVPPGATLDTPLLGRSGPTFVHRGRSVEAVDWHRRAGPDGAPPHDAGLAAALAHAAGTEVRTTLLAAPPVHWTADGEGTLVVSAALLDPATNPGWTRTAVEDELRGLLGAERVLWLPTVGERHAGPFGGTAHLHSWLRCVGEGEVLVHWQGDRRRPDHGVGVAALHALRGAVDARGRLLRAHTVPAAPGEAGQEPAALACSLTDLVRVGDHVLRPAFPEARVDEAARDLAERVHPAVTQLPFPLPPLLHLVGSFSDLLVLQPQA